MSSTQRIRCGIASYTWFPCSSYSARVCMWHGLCPSAPALLQHLDPTQKPVFHGVAPVPLILKLWISGEIFSCELIFY